MLVAALRSEALEEKMPDLGPQTANAEGVLISLSSRICAEFMLGKARFPGMHGEPVWIQPARMLLGTYKRILGEDDYQKFLDQMKPALHVLGDLLFDEIVGLQHQKEHIEALKKFDTPVRVAIETLLRNMTGKNESRGGPGAGRWNNHLWMLRSLVDGVISTSISGISHEDIRKGYNPLLHQLIDQLYEHRDTLVN